MECQEVTQSNDIVYVMQQEETDTSPKINLIQLNLLLPNNDAVNKYLDHRKMNES